MHANYVIKVIIKTLFFFQTHATLWRSKPTYRPQHILLRNKHNCSYSITHPCYFQHLVTWLFVLHKTHTTDFISNSAPPKQKPPLLSKHPRTQSSSSLHMQTTHTNYALSQLFIKFTHFSLRLCMNQ